MRSFAETMSLKASATRPTRPPSWVGRRTEKSPPRMACKASKSCNRSSAPPLSLVPLAATDSGVGTRSASASGCLSRAASLGVMAHQKMDESKKQPGRARTERETAPVPLRMQAEPHTPSQLRRRRRKRGLRQRRHKGVTTASWCRPESVYLQRCAGVFTEVFKSRSGWPSVEYCYLSARPSRHWHLDSSDRLIGLKSGRLQPVLPRSAISTKAAARYIGTENRASGHDRERDDALPATV